MLEATPIGANGQPITDHQLEPNDQTTFKFRITNRHAFPVADVIWVIRLDRDPTEDPDKGPLVLGTSEGQREGPLASGQAFDIESKPLIAEGAEPGEYSAFVLLSYTAHQDEPFTFEVVPD